MQFSQSADNNKQAILERLQAVLPSGGRVLEIASGTGQHAVHCASNWPDVVWQPSDRDLDVMDLLPRLADADLENVLNPIVLDIAHWPSLRPKFDAVFSANCVHIAPLELLEPYIAGCSKSLKRGGKMCLYGPFKYGGDFTTPSNADFDVFLRETYEGGGIRDFETVRDLAAAYTLGFEKDHDMPANNQFLTFLKK